MGFVYYGLSVQSLALGGNKFSNFIWISISEVPACVISYFLMVMVVCPTNFLLVSISFFLLFD